VLKLLGRNVHDKERHQQNAQMIAGDCMSVSARMIFVCSREIHIAGTVLKHIVEKRDFCAVYLET